MNEIIYAIAGLLIGWLLAKLLTPKTGISKNEFELISKELENAKYKISGLEAKNTKLDEDVAALQKELRSIREQKELLSNELASKKTDFDNRVKLNEKYEKEILEFKDHISKQQTTINSLNQESSSLSANVKLMSELNENNKKEITRLAEESAHLQKLLLAASEKRSEAEKENSYLKEKLEKQKEEIENIGQRFSNEFKVLADSILEEKSKKFTEINQTNILNILQPLGKNIDEFKRKVDETYDKESKQRFSLEEKIKDLVVLNKQISEEANNLTKALKGEAKTQGDWGEMILETILEKSGLVKNREYFVQDYIKNDSGEIIQNEKGEKLRPDVTIVYPDNRKVIIDSKVSLTAYERYVTYDNSDDKKKALSEHLKSIRAHIDGLSAKNYQDFAKSLDFVMMFVPIEPAYLIAMQNDHEIWNYAYNKRVLLISPTNLIAALKMIADLWKRELQNRNAIEIAEQSGALYDKFCGLVDDLNDIGSNIDRTQKSYQSALNKLKDGKGNLLVRVEKLKELGAKAKKNLPIDFAANNLLSSGD